MFTISINGKRFNCGRSAASAALLVTSVIACQAAARQQLYKVAETIPLYRRPGSAMGALQVLNDARITKTIRDELWGKGDWSYVFLPTSTIYKEFSAAPPRNAILRIISLRGNVLAKEQLNTPLAGVRPWNPSEVSSKLFLLTQDYSTGVGSYHGPETTLLRVSDSDFHRVLAFDPKSGRNVPLRLMKSLKSDWQIVQRSAKGEILSISCHPNAHGTFVVDYARYSFNGTKWLVYKREVNGYWEADGAFPKRSAFP